MRKLGQSNLNLIYHVFSSQTDWNNALIYVMFIFIDIVFYWIGIEMKVICSVVGMVVARSSRESVSRNATTLRYKRKFCLNFFITYQLSAPAFGHPQGLSFLQHVCTHFGELRFLNSYLQYYPCHACNKGVLTYMCITLGLKNVTKTMTYA